MTDRPADPLAFIAVPRVRQKKRGSKPETPRAFIAALAETRKVTGRNPQSHRRRVPCEEVTRV